MKLLRHRAFFTLALLLFTLALLAATPQLGRVARLVPLVVIVPTLVLLSLQLADDLIPRFRSFWEDKGRARWIPLPERSAREGRDRESGRKSPGDTTRGAARDATPDARREAGPVARRGGSPAGRLGWTLLLPLMIYALGFCVAIPVHALVYLRRFSGERWRLSVGIPLGLLCLLLLLPRLVPGVSLWPGWIWARLGLA